jgi:ABC-type protease/lipase transport system fused ATPase/permease subunit
MRSRGAAIVIAAHRKTVLDYCDRILVLEAGRPRLLGKTASVLSQLMGPKKSETAA